MPDEKCILNRGAAYFGIAIRLPNLERIPHEHFCQNQLHQLSR